ncbi:MULTISPECIES: DUF4258 domain-containing protein [Curtobacterium]|uniref:DUF4258 domain-containing protein n=1 Tax=Curtobacterium flaccumfaciens TaxID=2035 RepID=UPI003101EA9C
MITAATLALTSVAPSPIDPRVDDLERAVAAQPDGYVDTPSVPEGQLSLDGRSLTAPSPDGSVEVRLPLASAALGIDNPTAHGSRALAVEDQGDGAWRALLHLADGGTDPARFAFDFEDGTELIPLEDGGVTVRNADGDLLGIVGEPWAVDAAGNAVPTHFEVDGSTLVQHVQPDASTRFPVVADPFWIPALLVMAHLTRHALAQAAKRGVSQALIKQVVQNGKRSAGNKGTSVFTQGTGKNRVRVVVDNKSGNIITVTRG